MRESVLWGLVTGVAAAAVAWLSDRLGAGTSVSLFPDLLSLLTLVVVATIALRRVMRAAPGVTEAKRRGIALGVTVAAVVALATLLRGLIGWSSPDVMLAAVTMVASFVIVLLIMFAVGPVGHGSHQRDSEPHV